MSESDFTFLDPGALRDGKLELVLVDRQRAAESIWGVPAYIFHMRRTGSGLKMGHINLRIGDRWNIRYAGQIGYNVEEAYRGHHYAERSCRLLLPVARQHGLNELWITCNPGNLASRRTLERLGAELVETVAVPPEYPMPDDGVRQKCRFRLRLSGECGGARAPR